MNNGFLWHITPDDQFTWSRQEIAKELPGFNFVGAGWYNTQGSWMLVVATNTPDVYTLQVFYDRDPRPAFVAVAGAPVRNKEKITKVKKTFPYAGIIIWVAFLLFILPLGIITAHKFGNWTTLIMLISGILLGLIARFFRNRLQK